MRCAGPSGRPSAPPLSREASASLPLSRPPSPSLSPSSLPRALSLSLFTLLLSRAPFEPHPSSPPLLSSPPARAALQLGRERRGAQQQQPHSHTERVLF
eukprot:scaffold118511_cov28-Tisochrysis_lutea.AAC.3